MAKNPAREQITHMFNYDGKPYGKCPRCKYYIKEPGCKERCQKFDEFKPTVGFTCYEYGSNR